MVASKVRLQPKRIHRSKQKGRARSETQRIARQFAINYWQNLCESIQTSVDCDNIRAMYEGMKKAFGPCAIKTAPLKTTTGEIITDRAKQMERWAEHYQELYSRETVVTNIAVENTSLLPVTEELDDPPTIEELSKAIDSLASGKAPGNDGIPLEVMKAGKDTSLLEHLYELLLQYWEEGSVPQDMRDANIITLYKNKGDRSDCNNYRGISVLSIVGLRLCHAEQTADTSRARVPRSTVRVLSWEVDDWHDILPGAAAREMPRAEKPPVHRFYRPDQGVRPCQQVRFIHTPAQNRMLPQAPEDDHFLPWGNERHHTV